MLERKPIRQSYCKHFVSTLAPTSYLSLSGQAFIVYAAGVLEPHNQCVAENLVDPPGQGDQGGDLQPHAS